MPRLSMKLAVGIAVALSIIASAMVYAYLRDVVTQNQENMKPVVVMAQTVAPKTILTRQMLKMGSVPSTFVQPGAISKMETAVGVMVKEQLVAGEQVVTHRLLLDTGSGSGLAYQLTPGQRAYTIGVSETSAVAGFIHPGDKVDILVTYARGLGGDAFSQLMLQDILVLAMNRNDASPKDVNDKSAPDKVATVTVALSPEESAKLALAEGIGHVSLTLRPFAAEARSIVPVRAITPRDLAGYLYRSPQTESMPPASMPVMNTQARPERVFDGGSMIEVAHGTKVERVSVR